MRHASFVGHCDPPLHCTIPESADLSPLIDRKQPLLRRATLEKSLLGIEVIDRMNFRTLDLNLLRVLDAVMKEGSTVGAARRLGLSQPAISAALNRLRCAIGDELLVRRGNRLEPTDFARDLANPLRQTLAELEALLEPCAFDPAASHATLRLSGPDYYSDMILPLIARALEHEAPGIRLQMFDLVPEDHFGTLDRYEVDLLLMPEGPLPDWAMSHVIFHSAFALLARRDHPLIEWNEDGPHMSLDAFCTAEHILYSPSGDLRSFTDEALEQLGRHRQIRMTLPKFSAIAHTVSLTDMLGTMPRTLAASLAPAFGLVVMPPPVAIGPHPMLMVWSRRSNDNPAHRWLRDRIMELVEPLDDRITSPR